MQPPRIKSCQSSLNQRTSLMVLTAHRTLEIDFFHLVYKCTQLEMNSSEENEEASKLYEKLMGILIRYQKKIVMDTAI